MAKIYTEAFGESFLLSNKAGKQLELELSELKTLYEKLKALFKEPEPVQELPEVIEETPAPVIAPVPQEAKPTEASLRKESEGSALMKRMVQRR